MSADNNSANEGQLLARKFFVLTTLGVVAFCTVVALVIAFAHSNGGEPVPSSLPVHVAAHP